MKIIKTTGDDWLRMVSGGGSSVVVTTGDVSDW